MFCVEDERGGAARAGFILESVNSGTHEIEHTFKNKYHLKFPVCHLHKEYDDVYLLLLQSFLLLYQILIIGCESAVGLTRNR